MQNPESTEPRKIYRLENTNIIFKEKNWEYKLERLKSNMIKNWHIILIIIAVLAFSLFTSSCTKTQINPTSAQTQAASGTSPEALKVTLEVYFQHPAPDSASYSIPIPGISKNAATRNQYSEWNTTIKKGNLLPYQIQAFTSGAQLGNSDSLSLKIYINGTIYKQSSGPNSVTILFAY